MLSDVVLKIAIAGCFLWGTGFASWGVAQQKSDQGQSSEVQSQNVSDDGSNLSSKEKAYKSEIEHLNSDLESNGMKEINLEEMNIHSPNAYQYFYNQHQKEINEAYDELNYKKQIDQINSQIKDKGEALIQIDFSSQTPYKGAYHKNNDLILKYQDENYAKKLIESISLDRVAKGLKALEVPKDGPFPYHTFYKKHENEIDNYHNDSQYKSIVETYLSMSKKGLLKNIGSPDPTAIAPYTKFYFDNKAALSSVEDELKYKPLIENYNMQLNQLSFKTNLTPVEVNISSGSLFPYTAAYNANKEKINEISTANIYYDETAHELNCAKSTKQEKFDECTCHLNEKCGNQNLKKLANFSEDVSAAAKNADRKRKVIEILHNLSSRAEYLLMEALKGRKQYRDCGLSDIEIKTILGYSWRDYKAINQAFYGGNEESQQKLKPYVDTLDQALEKLAPYKGFVYHGTHLPKDEIKKYKEGAIITREAFTSTTTQQLTASQMGQQRFIIYSEKGRYIAPLSFYPSEEEVLFKAHSRFKVLYADQANTTFILEEIVGK